MRRLSDLHEREPINKMVCYHIWIDTQSRLPLNLWKSPQQAKEWDDVWDDVITVSLVNLDNAMEQGLELMNKNPGD